MLPASRSTFQNLWHTMGSLKKAENVRFAEIRACQRRTSDPSRSTFQNLWHTMGSLKKAENVRFAEIRACQRRTSDPAQRKVSVPFHGDSACCQHHVALFRPFGTP